MDCLINKQPNLFIVDVQKKELDITSKINQVVTAKIRPNSIGASHLKAQLEYDGEDAEIWVFVGGDSSDYI